MKTPVVYHCSSSVVWARDANCLWVVDEETGCLWPLRGAEAAVWDWLAAGYPAERLRYMLSVLLSVPEEDAAQKLYHILHWWCDAGIVQMVEGQGDGESSDQHSM